LKLNLALQRVGAEDAGVHQIMSEVTHLVKRSSALRDPQIVNRVAALMSALECGPSRHFARCSDMSEFGGRPEVTG
jgi:hypothetical protein